MELAEGRSRRVVRANAGSNLQALLERGLDSEEERLLAEHSDDSSDSSFTVGSSVEVEDEIDSDFSDEEIEGTLRGEEVETEKDVRRVERRERRAAREKARRRVDLFVNRAAHVQHRKRTDAKKEKRHHRQKHPTHSSSRVGADDKVDTLTTKQQHSDDATLSKEDACQAMGDDGAEYALGAKKSDDEDNNEDEDNDEEDEEDVSAMLDLRSVVRHRPAPTIPHAVRMQAALIRADEQRQQQLHHYQDANSDEAMRHDSSTASVASLRSTRASRIDPVRVGSTNCASSVLRRRRERYKEQLQQQYAEEQHRYEVIQGVVRGRGGLQLASSSSLSSFLLGGTAVDWRSTLYDFTTASLDEGNKDKMLCGTTGTGAANRMCLQRVCYRSGVGVLKRYGVPTIISFSRGIPLVFKQSCARTNEDARATS